MRVAQLLVVALGFGSPLHDSALATPQETQGAARDRATRKTPKKPALSVRAIPAVSFSPARVRAVAELKGGPDDYRRSTAQPSSGIGATLTQSEEAADCEPYEAGSV